MGPGFKKGFTEARLGNFPLYCFDFGPVFGVKVLESIADLVQFVGEVGVAEWTDEWDVVEDVFPICFSAGAGISSGGAGVGAGGTGGAGTAAVAELVKELCKVHEERNEHPEDGQSSPVRMVLVDPVHDESPHIGSDIEEGYGNVEEREFGELCVEDGDDNGKDCGDSDVGVDDLFQDIDHPLTV